MLSSFFIQAEACTSCWNNTHCQGEMANFHGVYYRCYLPDEMKDKGYSVPYYDIPADKAKVIEL
jgi:hypothetical protein